MSLISSQHFLYNTCTLFTVRLIGAKFFLLTQRSTLCRSCNKGSDNNVQFAHWPKFAVTRDFRLRIDKKPQSMKISKSRETSTKSFVKECNLSLAEELVHSTSMSTFCFSMISHGPENICEGP